MYVYSFVYDDIQSSKEAEEFIQAVKRTLPVYLFKVPYQTEVDVASGLVIVEYALSDMDVNHVTLTAIEETYPRVEIGVYDDTRLLDVYPLEERPYFSEYFLQALSIS